MTAYIGHPSLKILLQDNQINGSGDSRASHQLKNQRDFKSNIDCLKSEPTSPKHYDDYGRDRMKSTEKKMTRNLLTSFEACTVL